MKLLSLICLSACMCIFWLPPCPAEGQRLPDSTNACQLLKQPVNFQSVRRNARKIITKSDDNCVLGFIDLLADSSFGRDHLQYLACLDAICKASDGYVADDLNDVCARLFHKNFNHLFEYIYKPDLSFKTKFELLLIEGVAADLSLTNDPAGYRTRFVTFLHRKEKELKMNSRQKDYAEALKDKILAYKVD